MHISDCLSPLFCLLFAHHAADISSDSEEDAVPDIKKADPSSPVSPLHSLYLADQEEFNPMRPQLHLRGPQGSGLEHLPDDGSVGSVDSSLDGSSAPGASGAAGETKAERKKRKKLKTKKNRNVDNIPQGELLCVIMRSQVISRAVQGNTALFTILIKNRPADRTVD
jgi:hypothetical protein